MTTERFFIGILAGLAVAMFCAVPDAIRAQTASFPALAGAVSSQEEGPMEGVLVSAKRTGSTVTITVVSDAQGQYSFPPGRLAPGQYAVRIRAVGYELGKPGQVEVTAQKTVQLDLKLTKTGDLSRQLSNGEWLMSMTGTKEEKEIFLGCVGCHTLERVARSQHDTAEFVQVFQRMAQYAQGSTTTRPQLRPSALRAAGDTNATPATQERFAKQAEYAATINLSASSKFPYELKTAPRPKGKGTKVIITEYDLPRPEAMPHDAMIDAQGMVWYSDFGSQYLGRFDPKTADIVEYPVPLTDAKAPKGALDIALDRDGNIWLATMYQGTIARFDPKTERFQTWKSPTFGQRDTRPAMVTPGNAHVDGKVWVAVATDGEYQMDLESGEWKKIDYKRDIPKDSPLANRDLDSYGVASDSRNNFYGMNFAGEFITRVDAKTMKVTPFAVPTPDSRPRRGHMDAQDRLWFAEYRGNKIGMFDTRSERFQEWAVPTPWTNPYDAVVDKAGNAWTGGMSNDRVVRVNTKTGDVIEYLLPRTTNIRRVNVDNSTSPPAFWVGNNLGATLIKLEPLD